MARRWSRRLLIFLLVLFVGIPTVLVLFHFAVMAFYITRAREVRLEEFSPALPVVTPQELVLQRRVVPRSEYWRVALAMPPAPDASSYVFEILCYDPHHRIIVTSPDGTAHEVEICFHCRKMRVNSPWIGGTPLVWQRTLLSLFERYGMPERSSEEYSNLRRAASNHAMERTADRGTLHF